MAVPNLFHGSKCRVVFSNVPTLTSILNINLYDLYVKQVQIPSYNVLEYYSEFKGERKIHPISRQNTELQQLSIIFKCDEELANYFNLFEWMQELRYGQNVPTTFISDNVIKTITIELLDNEKRAKSRINFSNALLVGLSSLSMTMGSDDEVTFSCDFSYQEIKKETI